MLSIGLVGLPNAGKSTLFNALTQQNVLMASYPFATIKPNTGIMLLPDPRLAQLQTIFKSEKIIPANVTFIDIAGLVAGASKGEGLGNQFLSHIRETTVIAQIINAFDGIKDIPHNLEIIKTELLLADYEIISRQIQKIEKPARQDVQLKTLLQILQLAEKDINQNIPLDQSSEGSLYQEQLGFLQLLTLKPMIYVFNIAEEALQDQDLVAKLKEFVPGAPNIILSAKLELEISQLGSEEKNLFLQEYGLKISGLDQLVTIGFQLLKLQTFLTAGSKEVRAWTIAQDCLAPQAAGVIHSDMEKGFIAAEIINFDDLLKHQSWAAAKSAGVCRTEGKNYKMQMDDVVEFRFNV